MTSPVIADNTRQALGALRRAGLTFWRAPDGRLEVRPGSALTVEVREALWPHRAALLAAVAKLGAGEELWANAIRRAVSRGDDEAVAELLDGNIAGGRGGT